MLNSVFQAKLVDFGLVRIHECLPDYSYTEDSMTNVVDTIAYISPEMLNERRRIQLQNRYLFIRNFSLLFVYLKSTKTIDEREKKN